MGDHYPLLEHLDLSLDQAQERVRDLVTAIDG